MGQILRICQYLDIIFGHYTAIFGHNSAIFDQFCTEHQETTNHHVYIRNLSSDTYFLIFGRFWWENRHDRLCRRKMAWGLRSQPQNLAHCVDLLGKLLFSNNVFEIFKPEHHVHHLYDRFFLSKNV